MQQQDARKPAESYNLQCVPANGSPTSACLQLKPSALGDGQGFRFVHDRDEELLFVIEFRSGGTDPRGQARLGGAHRLPGTTGEIDSDWIEEEMRSGFLVHGADGTWADCAWDLVKETTA